MEKKKFVQPSVLHNGGVLTKPNEVFPECEFCTPPKFELGGLYATACALDELNRQDIHDAIYRHIQGDWGKVCRDDAEANEFALLNDLRIFSIYEDRAGIRFWIITEADRSLTTVLLPSDY